MEEGIRHGCYFNVDKEAHIDSTLIHTSQMTLYLPFCVNLFLLGTFIKPFGNIIGTLRA
jgi:hypothetical protein